MNGALDSKIPSGPLEKKWEKHKAESKLVNPANKRKFDVIVVGSGLAGASAAATLAELGYNVKCFCFQDSARRAHRIAAQGGINAAKSYQNDGDSVYRLFYDTIKGGDFRSREANVYRLAEVSAHIIDQCVTQGVPFAREYGGLLANRSFGGAQVSRTFYARGQTGQQLLLGAYQALSKQIALGSVKMFPRTEMLDLVVIDGHAKGIVVRDLINGEISSHAGDTVILATGGYGKRFLSLDQRAWMQRYCHLPGLQAGSILRQSLLHPDSSDLYSGERFVPIEADSDVGIVTKRWSRMGAFEERRYSVSATNSRSGA
jgi:succinate dehydrogenase / fumarate reductase flavoprotein subunit